MPRGKGKGKGKGEWNWKRKKKREGREGGWICQGTGGSLTVASTLLLIMREFVSVLVLVSCSS